MKNNKVRDEYYFYLRDRNHHPTVTVCIKRKGEEIARGLSILNPSDRINKKEGRKYARKYADKALGTKRTNYPIQKTEVLQLLERVYEYGSPHPIMETGNSFICEYKSVYDPVLTSYEYKLLTRERKGDEF